MREEFTLSAYYLPPYLVFDAIERLPFAISHKWRQPNVFFMMLNNLCLKFFLDLFLNLPVSILPKEKGSFLFSELL